VAIVDLRDMLDHARGHAYALAAFEVTDLSFLHGILAGAVGQQAPVILSLGASCQDPARQADLLAAMESAAQRAAVPVAIHYDGTTSMEAAVHAINRGCNSIGLAPFLGQDAALSRRIVEMAHDCGIPVTGSAAAAAVDGAQISAYLRDSGVDFLELGRPDSEAFFQRLPQDAAVPLWIREGAALTAEQRRTLIAQGVAAVLPGAALQDVAARCLAVGHEGYGQLAAAVDSAIADSVGAALAQWGAAGQAAAALQHCRSWAPVEHLIIYNVAGISAQQAEAMMAEGREILGAIPGVRRVFTGSAVQEAAAYRYCWLVRFVHPRVIDSYRNHPAHVAFADQCFRPVAGERISIDYQASPG